MIPQHAASLASIGGGKVRCPHVMGTASSSWNRYLIPMLVHPWKEKGLSNRKRKLVFFRQGTAGPRVATFKHG